MDRIHPFWRRLRKLLHHDQPDDASGSRRLLLEESLAAFPHPFLAIDRRWRLLLTNSAAEEAFSSHLEHSGPAREQTIWEIFPWLKGSSLQSALSQAMEGREPDRIEVYISDYDAHFDIQIQPHRQDLFLFFTDISDEKENQKRLREMESVVLFSNDAVVITRADPIDPPGPEIIFVNQAFSRMTGWAPEEVIGRTPRILQGEGTSKAATDKIRHALLRREPVRVELINYRKDRSPFLVEISIAPVFDQTGALLRFIAVQREVTQIQKPSLVIQEATRARLAAERSLKELAAIFDHSMDAVLLTNGFGKILLANKASRQLFGYPEDDFIGMNLSQLAPAGDPNMEGALIELTQTGHFRGELIFCRHNDSPFAGEASSSLFSDENNQRFMTFFIRDVSERKAREAERECLIERLEDTEEDLLHAAQARKEVLGIVAHDLRSPLTAALLQSEILLHTGLNGGARLGPQVEALQHQLRRMERLIRDLLDVAQFEEDALSVHLEPLVVDELLHQVLKIIEPIAAEQKISIDLQLQDSSLTVRGDPHRLHQALENLLSNALKFTPPEGKICIGAQSNQGEIIFSIADTGAGIPDEELPHLFQRFWQGHASDHRGVGLGLSIVQSIIEAHGGRIWARSQVGKGTTIYFCIPQAHSSLSTPASP